MSNEISQFESLIQLDKAFSTGSRYSDEDICAFEERYNLNLPDDYKVFLRQIGTVEYDYGSYGSKFWFLKLEEIEAWSQKVFPESENLFPSVLLVAASTSGEHYGLIKGRSELFVFDPECPCYLWLEEQMSEFKFNDWLKLITESKMESTW
ncbi:SMI1/KNR4 family protein [Pseudoalteromonas sp. SWXJZ94C]|uniref:SMI1/KNR4 family protein n=1 Tax=Pseudoalteromonas sp. SWXJZ94C TaxID=2792065 RepID=UPI0018CC8F85|nr:SMI1/KNR4 family protein [Pseudoalteromonas sp. SWXJZ94C]MBH0059310.1 SMI1/KNR4 family protein [Pseudoalteromonas sp. SWXJZ94C]